ncbi:hypothetical protein OG689_10830 [Kitasatospora sp. NBC_00240]|uniref:hypothetical protein n=1 Tax=Kitasatospora sp. NBC_00240 TaxID=2903567 RepID=UPI0022534527|nr:hypothetical protein [Kitasatospora sp. NBC_00240]MCX5209778.1 hypothetical protein [Kitasatospora sp. NBC_00240]
MSASTVSRPTEAAAIGRYRPPALPSVAQLLHLRAQARHRLDLAFAHLLDHQLVRVLANGKVGEL